jgi:hypothetical protein
MDDRFTLLNLTDDDVVSFSDQTFKIGQLKQQLQICLMSINGTGYASAFLDISSGKLPIKAARINWQSTIMNGEILMLASKSWQKGKMKIHADIDTAKNQLEIRNVRVDFCPDEPEIIPLESPLDDLRQMMNQENS